MTVALLLAPALGLAANAVLHALLARTRLKIGPVRLQFVCFALGAVLVAAVLGNMLSALPMRATDKACYLVLHLSIYVCVGFCFFNVISANVSSLRVRILRELLAQNPRPIDTSALQFRYPEREILFARLGRLEAAGHVLRRADRYYLRKRSILHIADFFAALRRLLLLA